MPVTVMKAVEFDRDVYEFYGKDDAIATRMHYTVANLQSDKPQKKQVPS